MLFLFKRNLLLNIIFFKYIPFSYPHPLGGKIENPYSLHLEDSMYKAWDGEDEVY